MSGQVKLKKDYSNNGSALTKVSDCSERPGSVCASLKAKNLSLHYGDFKAYDNVNIEIEPCKITALVGPSGCGKTSFLNSVNRLVDLIPGSKLRGELSFGNTDILSPSCDLIELRRKIGMVFQRPAPFPFSIRKNFHIPLKEHGVSKSSIRDERMEQSLKDVGLWDEVKTRLKQSACNLSGGQQQRLCIARTLSLKPELLLMDEPCSALDPVSSEKIEQLILSLRDNYTVLMVTHNLAQAKRISDNLLVCWVRNGSGCLIETGKTSEIFAAPAEKLTKDYLQGVRG